MPDLYITEYRGVGGLGNSPVPAPIVPPVAQQVVTFSTSTQSTVFNEGAVLVMVLATAACHLEFGANPTATTARTKIPADTPMFFWLGGPNLRVAAISAA